MKCLVIIPTYNEIDNLETLIVDDNSPDGTGSKADLLAKQDCRIHVMHRESKPGLGAAYIAGFKYAINQKYDVIFEMDADFSHDPKYLNKAIQDLLKTFHLQSYRNRSLGCKSPAGLQCNRSPHPESRSKLAYLLPRSVLWGGLCTITYD